VTEGTATTDVAHVEAPTHLVRCLRLTDATMIVIGSMVGSGIFIVSADIARQVNSSGLLLTVWLVAGFMTVVAALYYGELAASMPHAGGQYVYIREMFGPLWGFLYGWSMLLVIQTATIAAVAIAFAKFTGVLFPWFSSSAWILKLGTLGPFSFWFGELGPYNIGLNTQNLLAILSIALLTWVNLRGITLGTLVQNLFTYTKIGVLAGVILLGVLFANASALKANFSALWQPLNPGLANAWQGDWGTALTIIGVAMVGSLFAADAWNNVTFVGGEVQDPERNLPRALALGAGLVILLYVLVNLAYLSVLPLAGDPAAPDVIGRGIQFAAEDRVASAVAEAAFGPAGAAVMALAVMISTFGCNNGLILSGARISYAMAKDGLFFKAAAGLNAQHAPAAALFVQGIWASLLCLSGTYGQLLDFLMFTVLLFYMLTIVGFLRRRMSQPNTPKRWDIPLLPLIYVALALFIEIQLLRYKPQFTWPGLIVVLVGVPVYVAWRKTGTADADAR